jgi:3',5'-cyclic AMP phosphodiesterase CpdA
VLHLGDLVYGGAGYDFNGRKSWFRMLRIIDCYRSSAFMAIALGNHDVTPEAYSWGPDYFGDIPAVQSNSAGEAKPPYYYSFDVANVHFIALCTEARRTDKNGDVSDQMLFDTFTYNQQLAWLAEDLKNAKAEWIIVFSHQPLHTVGGYSAHVSFQKDVGALLDQYKVPLMISAHDHSYQRTWRIGNLDRKKRDDGTVQVISGGASNFFSGGSRDWNIHYMRTNHYMRVAVDGDAITFKAVGVEGEIIDHWRLKKNGQPEDLPVN